MAKSTQGLHTSVPCPHCGGEMNFNEFIAEEDGGAAPASLIDKDTAVDCDNPKCKKTSRIANMRRMIVIKLVAVQEPAGK